MAFSKQQALDLLKKAHTRGRLGHAYLISGSEGSGTRELCRELCALVNPGFARLAAGWVHPEVHVVEPESKSRRILIEQIRDLEHALRMKSGAEGRKVGVIFEADRMVVPASNAFLRTLEEPPGSTIFLLVTAQPQVLLDTIISRCVSVALHAPGQVPPTPGQAVVTDLLADHFAHPAPGVAPMLRLARAFLDELGAVREEIRKEHEAEREIEEDRYARTTDGDWLKHRDEHYSALTESRYTQERARLIDALGAWWVRVLRAQHKAGEGQGEHGPLIVALAARLPVSDVLQRVERIEELREHLDRNIQETLAVETAFLRAFRG